MNATIAQIEEYRARFGLVDKRAVRDCVHVAVHGRYCEDCYAELQALDDFYERRRVRLTRSEGHLYIRVALETAKRLEWIGTLTMVAIGVAMILIEFAPWFLDVARRFKDVLFWGK
jgi:hypothetical protein